MNPTVLVGRFFGGGVKGITYVIVWVRINKKKNEERKF